MSKIRHFYSMFCLIVSNTMSSRNFGEKLTKFVKLTNFVKKGGTWPENEKVATWNAPHRPFVCLNLENYGKI